MSTVSAANRLRDKVSAINGTCLLVTAGHPDKIIRFQALPGSLEKLYFDKAAAEGIKTKEVIYPVMINLDRGPDQEAWNAAKREFFLMARRDRPIPEPLPVSEDSHMDWSVDAEDVPVIENAIAAPVVHVPSLNSDISPVAADAERTCDNCMAEFKTEHALKIHKARAKH